MRNGKARDGAWPEVMTAQEAAPYLRTSVKTLYKMLQEEDIPYRRSGRQFILRKSALDRWLEKR